MTFLDDFRELLLREPKHFAPRQDVENSDYTCLCYKTKDSYMCFGCDYVEDCFYMNHSERDKDCMDGMMVWEGELAYECMDSIKMYNCDFCWNSNGLTDCFLCEDCRACSNCFGCSGLRRKKYHIFNEPCDSKEEYEEKMAKFRKQFFEEGRWSEVAESLKGSVMEKFDRVRFSVPHIQWQQTRCEDSVCDYCEGCNRCHECFDSKDCEDCCYVQGGFGSKDSVDCYYLHKGTLCYDMMSVDRVWNCDFGFWFIGCKDCQVGYCLNSCENCFGCVNLKHKKYHILNEEYSKEEYARKRDEIVAELKESGLWGENLIYEALKDVELGDMV